MRLRGRARLRSDREITDFDYMDWWKALVDKGLSPSEAWQCDHIETVVLLETKPTNTDTTMVLYHQRKSNGANGNWLEGVNNDD